MAIGARLFLVSPDDAPGEIRHILLTLIVLQLYEWCVGAVLVALHQSRRSPEDKPSLLLIAALFWTGPLVATMEMSALRGDLGLILAGLACVIALAELHAIRHALRLEINLAAQLAGGLCILAVAVAQPMLKIREGATETNELLLYGLWWLLPVVTLLMLPQAHRAFSSSHVTTSDSASGNPAINLAFIAITVCAAAAHLAAMNHAFFGHARWFYASGLLVATGVVGMEAAACARPLRWDVLALFAILPAAAVALSFDGFAPPFPVKSLPRLMREPLTLVLALAAGAYILAFIRTRLSIMLHVAVATSVWSLARLIHSYVPVDIAAYVPDFSAGVTRNQLGVIFLGAAAYMAMLGYLRRSRGFAVTALVCSFIGFSELVMDRLAGDTMIVCFAGAWTFLVCLHVALHRRPFLAALPVIAALAISSWIFSMDAGVGWVARWHAVAMVAVFLTWGQLQPWTHHRCVAVILAVMDVFAVTAHWLGRAHLPALVVVAGALTLLALGAAISWHKRRLLELTART